MTFATLKQKFELESGKHRLLQMEGLRGIAILLVFLLHYYSLVWVHERGSGTARHALDVIGGSGVDLFFVLSGYLIYGAVSNPNFRLGKFLRRRVERIYPAFLVVLLFYVSTSLVFGTDHGNGRATWNRIPVNTPGGTALYILQNMLFLPGVFAIQPIMNVAWSLSYEWFFYLFLPLAYWALRFRLAGARTRILAVGGIAATIAATQLILPLLFIRAENLSLATHIRSIMFLGGMIVYDLMHSVRGREFRAERLTWLFVPLMGAIVLILRWTPQPDQPTAMVRRETLISATLLVLYPLLVYIAIQGRSAIAAGLSWTPLRWLGNMSYSFYLFHAVALHGLGLIIVRLQGGAQATWLLAIESIAFLPVAFLITTASCIPLFLLVERPVSLSPNKRVPDSAATFVSRRGGVRAEVEAVGSRN
jgi:peptidoglycan/LPS O-acetylase OafA/YrhL